MKIVNFVSKSAKIVVALAGFWKPKPKGLYIVGIFTRKTLWKPSCSQRFWFWIVKNCGAGGVLGFESLKNVLPSAPFWIFGRHWSLQIYAPENIFLEANFAKCWNREKKRVFVAIILLAARLRIGPIHGFLWKNTSECFRIRVSGAKLTESKVFSVFLIPGGRLKGMKATFSTKLRIFSCFIRNPLHMDAGRYMFIRPGLGHLKIIVFARKIFFIRV